jgi:disulfide bond formation protein DsbB
MIASSLLAPPRRPALLVAAGSAATLASALLSQFVGGLAPCVLCLWQRWPHVAAIALAALAFVAFGRSRAVGSGLLALAGVALWVSAGIAAYHVGVEQHWWAGTAQCGAAGGTPTTLDDLRRMVLAAPVTRCDEVAWSFLGISMAGWNLLISLGLGALAVVAGLRPSIGARR